MLGLRLTRAGDMRSILVSPAHVTSVRRREWWTEVTLADGTMHCVLERGVGVAVRAMCRRWGCTARI